MTKAGVDYYYEKRKVVYVKEHSYLTDFELPNGIIVETKGYFKADDRAKHLEIKKAHPSLDIRFLFMQDNKIHSKSDTYYSDWCDKHGFKYAFSKLGIIPKAWLEE